MLAQIAGSGLALRQEGPENRTDDSEELLADMEERSHAADARTFMFEGLSPPPLSSPLHFPRFLFQNRSVIQVFFVSFLSLASLSLCRFHFLFLCCLVSLTVVRTWSIACLASLSLSLSLSLCSLLAVSRARSLSFSVSHALVRACALSPLVDTRDSHHTHISQATRSLWKNWRRNMAPTLLPWHVIARSMSTSTHQRN